MQSSTTGSVASASGSRALTPRPGDEAQRALTGDWRRAAFAHTWGVDPSAEKHVQLGHVKARLLEATHASIERRRQRLRATSPAAREDAHMEAGPCPSFLHSHATIARTYNADGRVGVYDGTGRAARLASYLYKRSRRRWSKGARYTSRQLVAQRRVRVNGRFIRAEEEEGLDEV